MSATPPPATSSRDSTGAWEGTPAERARLDRALARGVAWMGLAKWTTQLLAWTATLVVARLLTPADYGIVGMATIFLGVVTLASEFGIDAAVVTLRSLPEQVLHQLNTMAVLFGIVSHLLAWVAAPVLVWLFDAPALYSVVIVMSTSFLVLGFRVVPQALLMKGLRFRGLAAAEAGQALVMSTTMVVFAVLGFRYWTLVAGSVIGAVASTCFILAQSRCRFARPRWSELRPALTFSHHTIVARLSWYGYDNADFFIVGKVLGQSALGAYSIAWQFSSAIIEKITSLIGRVTPSVLSAAQTEPALLRRYLLGVTEAISLVTVPATIGLALVTEDLVIVALGEKWAAAVIPLRLLALYAAIRSITPFFAQVLIATGDAARVMRINVGGLVVLPVAFLVASRWGTAGIAAAWLVVHPVAVVWPAARAVFARLGVAWRAYAAALAPAASAVALMAGAVLVSRLLHPAEMSRVAELAADVGVGVVSYVLTLLVLYRERVRRLAEFTRLHLRPA